MDEQKEDLLQSAESEKSRELDESESTDSPRESSVTEESEQSPHSTFSNLANSRRSSENTSYYAPEKKKSKKPTLILIIGIIILIAGGYFVYSKKSTKPSENQPTESSNPTPAPTETPKPALNKADWTFEVLNGSGVTGLAKKIADQLQSLGYQVVKTGNADKDTYTETQILVKSDLKDKVDLVIADLKDVIKIASVGGELNDSTASARIIIGKE